jgi:hypothetical protein
MGTYSLIDRQHLSELKCCHEKTTQIAADRAHDETKTVLPAEVARGIYIENRRGLKLSS